MINWKEYLNTYTDISKDAFILEKKVEKIGKRFQIIPFISILSFVLSWYFLKDFISRNNFYSVISIGIYPYTVMAFFILFFGFADIFDLDKKWTLFFFLSYFFLMINLFLFFKYFLLIRASSSWSFFEKYFYSTNNEKIIKSELYNIRIAVILLLLSSIGCVILHIVDSYKKKNIRQIEMIIQNHEKDQVIKIGTTNGLSVEEATKEYEDGVRYFKNIRYKI